MDLCANGEKSVRRRTRRPTHCILHETRILKDALGPHVAAHGHVAGSERRAEPRARTRTRRPTSHPPLELLERRSTLRRATRRHATQLRTQNTAGTRSRRPRGAPGVRKWRSRSAGHERRVRAQIMDAPDATKRQRIIDDEVSQRHKDEDEANTRATNTNAWSQRRSD